MLLRRLSKSKCTENYVVYMFMSRHQATEQNYYINVAHESFENMLNSKINERR
jgi:hypothetical protein